jgi:hypothetical protein
MQRLAGGVPIRNHLCVAKATLKWPADKENVNDIPVWMKNQKNTNELLEKLKSGHIFVVRPELKKQLVYVDRPKKRYFNLKRNAG